VRSLGCEPWGRGSTTYGVQGATLDRARYHPSDGSRFEEGYVAITRATDSTSLYVVEGDIDVDAGNKAIESEATGLDTVVQALGRRSDHELATASDPFALEVDRLARTCSLRQLSERSRQLDAVLEQHPPSVAGELADAQCTLAALERRRLTMSAAIPSWKPSRRREAADALTSVERAIEHATHRVSDLDAQRADYDEFRVVHHVELEERRLLSQAVLVRRLKLTIDAVAKPAVAVVDMLGPRPESQRERLRWEHAVEAVVRYTDETGRLLPRTASSAVELLGPPPADPLDRLPYKRVCDTMRQVHAPEHRSGVALGIG